MSETLRERKFALPVIYLVCTSFALSASAVGQPLPPQTDFLMIAPVEGIDENGRLRFVKANQEVQIAEFKRELTQKGELPEWKQRKLTRLEQEYEQLSHTTFLDTSWNKISFEDARKVIDDRNLVIATNKSEMILPEHAARIRKGNVIVAGIAPNLMPTRHTTRVGLTLVDGIAADDVLQFTADIKNDKRYSFFYKQYSSLNNVMIFNTEGTRLTVEDARSQINPRTSIVLTGGGRMVPQAHANVFKKGTLIFVWPRHTSASLSGKIGEILTRKNYNDIKIGMSIENVKEMLFENDTARNRDLAGVDDVGPNTVYRLFWADPYGYGIGIILADGKVVEKFEKNLSKIEGRQESPK